MSRNPHATNLRHHKPRRIEDKRAEQDILRRVRECRAVMAAWAAEDE